MSPHKNLGSIFMLTKTPWKFYNVIRTVEETFHVLKTDLDAHCQHTGCGYSKS